MATIATHNGSAAHRAHNIRVERVVARQAHIQHGGDYEIWLDEEPRKAYERIFGDSVREYNARQKREDRKIRDYYNQIGRDEKKHPVYEMIVGVYQAEGEQISREQKKEILREYAGGWKERNPNLELIGLYWHADEEGGEHMHCDYIPVAHGYRRGPETQTGLVKALNEQGFWTSSTKLTAQICWESAENRTLEDICKRHGIEVEHPQVEKRQHLETDVYKAEAVIEHSLEVSYQANEAERLLEEREERLKELDAIPEEIPAPELLGKVLLDKGVFEALKERAALMKKLGDRLAKARQLELDAKRELDQAGQQRAENEKQRAAIVQVLNGEDYQKRQRELDGINTAIGKRQKEYNDLGQQKAGLADSVERLKEIVTDLAKERGALEKDLPSLREQRLQAAFCKERAPEYEAYRQQQERKRDRGYER